MSKSDRRMKHEYLRENSKGLVNTAADAKFVELLRDIINALPPGARTPRMEDLKVAVDTAEAVLTARTPR